MLRRVITGTREWETAGKRERESRVHGNGNHGYGGNGKGGYTGTGIVGTQERENP